MADSEGLKFPWGWLIAVASLAAFSLPKTRPKSSDCGRGHSQPQPAPPRSLEGTELLPLRDAPEPPPQHGRSDLPARVPASDGQAPLSRRSHTPRVKRKSRADNKAQPAGAQASWKLGALGLQPKEERRGGRDAELMRLGRGKPDVSPGAGSWEDTGRAATSGRRPGEDRPEAGGERRRGPEAPRSAVTPTSAGALPRSLPAGKLRAPPGLSRPLASGARKRPHIAGERAGWAGDARLLTSVLLLLRWRKLARSLGLGGTGRRKGGMAG